MSQGRAKFHISKHQMIGLFSGLLFVFLIFDARTISLGAQLSEVPSEIFFHSYEECLAKRRQLVEEANKVGDTAWEKTKALVGAVFTTSEIRALYAKSTELFKAADELRCLWKPEPKDGSRESEQIDKAMKRLAKGSFKEYPEFIQKLIQKQLKQVQEHNSVLVARLRQMGQDVIMRGSSAEGEAQPPEMVRRQREEESRRQAPDRSRAAAQACVGFHESYPFINNYGQRDLRICFKSQCCPPFD